MDNAKWLDDLGKKATETLEPDAKKTDLNMTKVAVILWIGEKVHFTLWDTTLLAGEKALEEWIEGTERQVLTCDGIMYPRI